MPDRMRPETRHAVTSAGGQGRAAALSPAQRSAIAAAGARAANTPAALARRIAKAWNTLSPDERAEVHAILEPVVRLGV